MLGPDDLIPAVLRVAKDDRAGGLERVVVVPQAAFFLFHWPCGKLGHLASQAAQDLAFARTERQVDRDPAFLDQIFHFCDIHNRILPWDRLFSSSITSIITLDREFQAPEEENMNSNERLQKRLRGEPVDRPPNFDILMTFAAHFIGQPLSRYYLNSRVLCEANLAVLEAFHLDIVQAISDPYREAADFGLEVEFPPDGLPLGKAPLIQEPEDLKKLAYPDPYTGRRMSDRLQAVRCLRAQVGGEAPVMGWVEGPWPRLATCAGSAR